MNLNFREITKSEEWDNFVKSLDRYTFLQSWNYSKVIEALYDEVYRIGIYQNDALVGLLPIAISHARRGAHMRLKHGPILGEKIKSIESMNELITFLRNFAAKKSLNFIRIQPAIEDEKLLTDSGFRIAPTHNLDAEHTLQLNLDGKTFDQVSMNMRKNTRYYIRKAFKDGVTVIEDNSKFEKFYEILIETSQRQGYTTWPREYFENLFKYFKQEDLHLYFAVVEEKEVAIGLFLDYGKYRFYLEGGMLTDYSKYYPSYAIQSRSIESAINRGTKLYDFWGGVSPEDAPANYPWAGIDLYKRGFGGERISIVHPHDLSLNWKYWLTWCYENIEKWRRGY